MAKQRIIPARPGSAAAPKSLAVEGPSSARYSAVLIAIRSSVIRMGRYLRPDSLDAVLAALQPGVAVLAGGTDFYPARVGRTVDEDVLDLTAVAGLRGIVHEPAPGGGCTRIGATATWRDVLEAPLPPAFRALQLAAREVGGEQIQNAGTVAGNLCNASPAADGVPALLALGADVEIASAAGTRAVPLAEFIVGPRRTALAPGEIVTAVLVPDASPLARSTFLKLGARRYLVISIAMVAALVDRGDNGLIRRCAISVGACSAVAKRLHALEFLLVGQPASPALADLATPAHLAPLAPLDDVRGTREYRLDAVLTLVRRALREVLYE